jgi:heat shock protein HslJ
MRFVICASCLLALSACHRPEPSVPIPDSLRPVLEITGPAWTLAEIAGVPVIAGSKASLDFLDTGKPNCRVSGDGSCNKFSGKAKIAAGTLQFSPLASTKMACSPNISAQEARYLQMLQSAERWEIRDRILFIYSKGSDKPLRFVQQ